MLGGRPRRAAGPRRRRQRLGSARAARSGASDAKNVRNEDRNEMNARTELAPEGWGLGDVMRPAARGRRRGLPPPVTSWGFGAGPAGPPQCWGAGSPLRGATGRSHAPTGERGARGSRPCRFPARAPGFVPSWAGRAGEGGGGRPEACAAARRTLEAGLLLPAGAGLRQPCLGFPPQRGRPPGELPAPRASASPRERSASSVLQRGGCLPGAGLPARRACPSLFFHLVKVPGPLPSPAGPAVGRGSL